MIAVLRYSDTFVNGPEARGDVRSPFPRTCGDGADNCTVHFRPDRCEVWTGSQVLTRAQGGAARVTGLPLDKVDVHNHYLGGGFGRRLEFDTSCRPCESGSRSRVRLR